MKLRVLSVFFLFWAISTFSFGQGVVTSVVSTNPPATACSNTIVTVAGTHNYGGYTFTGATVAVNGSTILITLNYSFGIGIAVITPFTQNVNIGMVPAGSYAIESYLVVNGTTSNLFVGSTISINACCGAVASLIPSATSVCVGDSIHLTNTSTGSIGQTWTDGTGFMYNSVNHSMLTTVPGPITFSLIVTNGTCSDTAQQTVNVLSIPVVDSLVPVVSQACVGQTIQINSYSSGATTTSNQKWFKNGVQVGFGPILQANSSISGFQTYVFTAGNAACSATDSVVIEFVAPPSIDTFTVANSICLGEAINCSSSNTGGTSSTWYLGSSPIGTNTTISHTPSIAGLVTIKLLVTNGICADSMQQVVNVKALPVLNLGPDTNTCNGSVVLNAGPGLTYLWNNGSTSQNLTVNASSGDTIICTVTNSGGCSISDTVLFTSCLALSEINNLQFSLSPNPTSNDLVIELGENAPEVLLRVYDANGKSLISKSFGSIEYISLDVSTFDRGVYFLELNTNKGKGVARWVKQ